MIEFLSTPDRSNKPAGSSTASCPGFAIGTTIFRRDPPALQCALTSPAASNACAARRRYCHPHPFQLLLNVGTMLKQSFVDSFSQFHERFNIHPRKICCCHDVLQQKTGLFYPVVVAPAMLPKWFSYLFATNSSTYNRINVEKFRRIEASLQQKYPLLESSTSSHGHFYCRLGA